MKTSFSGFIACSTARLVLEGKAGGKTAETQIMVWQKKKIALEKKKLKAFHCFQHALHSIFSQANTFSQFSRCIFIKASSCARSNTSPKRSWGISYLPHDCFSNCSSFSHLQGLTGAGGVRGPGSEEQWFPPPSLSVCPGCSCMCVSSTCSPHFTLHRLLPSCFLCVLHVSSFGAPGMKRIKLLPYFPDFTAHGLPKPTLSSFDFFFSA